jgi:hypothetical protein
MTETDDKPEALPAGIIIFGACVMLILAGVTTLVILADQGIIRI